MMKFVQFKKQPSGEDKPTDVAVNPEHVTHVIYIADDVTKIKFSDGTPVDVMLDFDAVLKRLSR